MIRSICKQKTWLPAAALAITLAASTSAYAATIVSENNKYFGKESCINYYNTESSIWYAASQCVIAYRKNSETEKCASKDDDIRGQNAENCVRIIPCGPIKKEECRTKCEAETQNFCSSVKR